MSFDSAVSESADGGPKSVDADVLIEVCAIVQSNPLEFLEVTREFLKFGETATTFLFDPDFDLTDPSTLEFNTLSDDLLPQPGMKLLNRGTSHDNEYGSLTVH